MTSTEQNQSTFDFFATWLRQTDPILSGAKPLSELFGERRLPSFIKAFQLASQPKFERLVGDLILQQKTLSSNSPTTESLITVAVPLEAE